MHLHKSCINVNNIIWGGVGGGEGGGGLNNREENKDKLMGENLLFPDDSLFTCLHL